jgi:hypothetical protein
MKLFTTAVLFATMTVATTFGQDTVGGEARSLAGLKPLDQIKTDSLWGQSGLASGRLQPRATVQLAQAPGVLEVTDSASSVFVVFRSVSPLPGSTLNFRATLPNGSVVNFDGYTVPQDWKGFNVYGEIWNGAFPGVWPSGWTLFEVLVSTPGKGVSYVSAEVPVRACCRNVGPIEEFTFRGQVLSVIGDFQSQETLQEAPATVNGILVGVHFVTKGYITSIGNIVNLNVGQNLFTLCVKGSCATRIFYTSRPPGK